MHYVTMKIRVGTGFEWSRVFGWWLLGLGPDVGSEKREER
jgi:hypothetical protein